MEESRLCVRKMERPSSVEHEFEATRVTGVADVERWIIRMSGMFKKTSVKAALVYPLYSLPRETPHSSMEQLTVWNALKDGRPQSISGSHKD